VDKTISGSLSGRLIHSNERFKLTAIYDEDRISPSSFRTCKRDRGYSSRVLEVVGRSVVVTAGPPMAFSLDGLARERGAIRSFSSLRCFHICKSLVVPVALGHVVSTVVNTSELPEPRTATATPRCNAGLVVMSFIFVFPAPSERCSGPFGWFAEVGEAMVPSSLTDMGRGQEVSEFFSPRSAPAQRIVRRVFGQRTAALQHCEQSSRESFLRVWSGVTCEPAFPMCFRESTASLR
jgi:hypothetical protein